MASITENTLVRAGIILDIICNMIDNLALSENDVLEIVQKELEHEFKAEHLHESAIQIVRAIELYIDDLMEDN